MNDDKVIQLNRIKITLWILFGLGCGVVGLGALLGAAWLVAPTASVVSFWLALAAFLVLFGGMAVELARGRSFSL